MAELGPHQENPHQVNPQQTEPIESQRQNNPANRAAEGIGGKRAYYPDEPESHPDR